MSDNKTVNHMIELTKTNRITFGVIIVLVILLLGFLFLKPVKYAFNTTLDKEIADLKVADYQISPQALAQALLKKDASMVCVDVRSPFEFAKGHLPEAQNIYKVNLFTDDQIEFFKDLKKGNKTAVLYGGSASEANVPFMILKQMGIDNVKYLTVGYEVMKSGNWTEIAANTTQYNDETPVVDFAKFISDAQVQNQHTVTATDNAPKPEISKPKTVVKPATPAAGGGDEGC
jgi:rhodanese-related sulfurtransferase